MDLNHFHLQVKNMKNSCAFYEKYFEFKEEFFVDKKNIFLQNRAGFFLGLKEVESPEILPSWFHFGFGTKDEKQIRELFVKMKYEQQAIVRNLQDSDDPINFHCTDPDGNNIEVYYKQ